MTPRLFGRTIAGLERELILETLERCGGNRTHAAKLLRVSVRTLRNKIKQYACEGCSIPPPQSEPVSHQRHW